MKLLITAAATALLLSGCGREGTPEPTADFAEPAGTSTAASGTSGTITPGTTERATTATATVAPVAPTRTTTDAPAGSMTTDAAPSPTAEIIDGRPIFAARCAQCHGAAGERVHGAGRSLRSAAVQQQPEAAIASAIRERAPHRQITLSGGEVNAVAAYVKALD